MFSYQSRQKSKKTPNLIQQQQPQQQRQKIHPQAILQRTQMNPGSLSQGDVLQLQRTIGNRAVGNLIQAKMGVDGTTVQRKLSENEGAEKKKERKIKTQEAVNKAPERINEGAFSVEAIVFSDVEGEIHRVAPMTQESRNNLPKDNKGKILPPKTDKSQIRNNPDNPKEPKTVGPKSKDGEIYLIDKLNEFFAKYLFNKAKLDMMKMPEAKVEHLRIELVGPRGTCEDCQAALQKWLHSDLQGKANEAEIGQKVSFSLVTRYLPENNSKQEGQGSHASKARVGTGAEIMKMGSMYGHPDAKRKPKGIETFAKEDKGYVPQEQRPNPTEHYRLKYKSEQSKPPQKVEGVTETKNPGNSSVTDKDGFTMVTKRKGKKTDKK